MSRYDHRRNDNTDATPTGAGAGASPGKRTLTQSLPAVQRSLRDQQRPVADFDAGVNGDIPGTRSTIDTPTDHGPEVSDQQIENAKRRNPHWIRKLRIAADVFSNAPVDSAAFAFDVAQKQAEQGLRVDGIAGRKTVAAVGAAATAERSRPAPAKGARPARANAPAKPGPPSPRAILDRDGDMNPDAPQADASRGVLDADGDMIPDAAQADTGRGVLDADGDMIPDAAQADTGRAVLDADGDMIPDEPFAGDDPFGMHLIGQG